MRTTDPFLREAKQAIARSRADVERQKERLRQVAVTTSAVHRRIERTKLLLKDIESALLRFKATR